MTLAVGFLAMRNPQDEDRFISVVDPADYTIIARSVTPQSSLVSSHRFPQVTRIVSAENATLEKPNNASLDYSIQLFQFFEGARIEASGPGQDALPPC